MSLALAVVSGVGYGVLHGLGPDHCAAIAALSVRSPHARQTTWAGVSVGIRFGLSHATALTALALASVLLGLTIPPELEQTFELLGGVLLAVLGVLALRSEGTEVLLHRHPHATPALGGWHAHLEEPAVQLSRMPAPARVGLWGTAFAASGARSLALVLSPMLLSSESWASGLAFVLAFGVGVSAAMVMCGLLLSLLQRAVPTARAPEFQRWLSRGIGVLSIGLACWWMWKSAALI